MCRLAASAYGLTALAAVTTCDNAASRTVLERNGFTAVGDTVVAGRPGIRYRRPLTAPHGTGGTGGTGTEETGATDKSRSCRTR